MELASEAKKSQYGVKKQVGNEKRACFRWRWQLFKQPLTVCQGLQFLGHGKCCISGGVNEDLSSVSLWSALDRVVTFQCLYMNKDDNFENRLMSSQKGNVTSSVGVAVNNITVLSSPARSVEQFSIVS